MTELVPGAAHATDYLMWAGVQHYPWPHDFTDEARTCGVSKRISRSAVPDIIPGASRLAIIHPRAIVQVSERYTLHDLAAALGLDQEYTLDQVRRALAALEQTDRPAYRDLVTRFDLTLAPGVIGYTYLEAVQYVLRPGETAPPPEMTARGVQGVRVIPTSPTEETHE